MKTQFRILSIFIFMAVTSGVLAGDLFYRSDALFVPKSASLKQISDSLENTAGNIGIDYKMGPLEFINLKAGCFFMSRSIRIENPLMYLEGYQYFSAVQFNQSENRLQVNTVSGIFSPYMVNAYMLKMIDQNLAASIKGTARTPSRKINPWIFNGLNFFSPNLGWEYLTFNKAGYSPAMKSVIHACYAALDLLSVGLIIGGALDKDPKKSADTVSGGVILLLLNRFIGATGNVDLVFYNHLVKEGYDLSGSEFTILAKTKI